MSSISDKLLIVSAIIMLIIGITQTEKKSDKVHKDMMIEIEKMKVMIEEMKTK